MSDLLRNFFQNSFPLPEDAIVLVGVSGGADSIALLASLRKSGIKTVAACLDHGLREESADEVLFVRDYTQSIGAAFLTAKLNVKSFAKSQKLGIEEAARLLRYQQLFTLAEEIDSAAVAVAHHEDDQVETILMHFLRGSGSPGLRGMLPVDVSHAWNSDIPLIRPLLRVRRQEIIEFLTAEGIDWIEDQSNQDVSFYRNQLRHEVIPWLEEIQPGFGSRILQTGQILQEEDRLLNKLVEDGMEMALRENGAGWFCLDREAFQSVDLAIQRRMILALVQSLNPDLRDFDFRAVENVREFISEGGAGRRLSLPDNLECLAEYYSVFLYVQDAVLPLDQYPQWGPEAMKLEWKKQNIRMENGWELRIRVIEKEDHAVENNWQLQLQPGMEDMYGIRSRQPGDKMRIEGMQTGNVKLKDLLINEKVPARYRAAYPVLTLNDELIWAPGLRKAVLPQISTGQPLYFMEWIPPV